MFGAAKASGSRRFHPSVTELQVDGPDNRGRVTLKLNWHDGITTIVQVEAEEWARLRPMLDEFAAAVNAAR